MDWTHAAAAISAAFLGSLVEFVEALTIILAVGITRGWKAALAGAAAGTVALVALVAALGPALSRVPIHALQIFVGILLLLFGMRWLRKAILRAGGVIRLHDEEATYARETKILSTGHLARRAGVDPLGFATAFKAVLLEGVEVAFIVVAVGSAGGMLIPAGLGALAALVLVALAGLLLHRPLARVPENTLKFSVGVLISAFGVFWLGEGIGADWPGEDLILFPLIAAVAGAALAAVAMVRRIMAEETVA